MLKQVAALGRVYLFSPTRGAASARQEKNFVPSLWLYAAFMAGYLAFYWLKPWDFPDALAAYPRESLDLGFWLKVLLWQPPLELAWIVLLGALVVWFKEGGLPVRLTAGVAWVMAPFLLMVSYAQAQGISKTAFALGSLGWLVLFVPLLRKVPREDWKPLVSFMLGINVIGLALLVPMQAAVWLRQSELFNAAQVVGGLWILGAGTLGLRALTGLRLPRAFMAVLLSMFFQVALAFTLHLLGVVPKEILKALLYA